MKNVAEMSTQELEQFVAQRKNEERKAREKAKQSYVEERDAMILELVSQAKNVHDLLTRFKTKVAEAVDRQQESLTNYGMIRANSKGGYSIVNEAETFKITRERSTKPSWDERGAKGIELIKDFLEDCVKKKDLQMFQILMAFIAKNNNNDLEYAKVMELIKHKNYSNDPRWLEGIQLVEESYTVNFRKYGYQFYKKNEQGSWEQIDLNFSTVNG
jgi:hypothetical protein